MLLSPTPKSSPHDPDDYDRRYHELENRHRQLETEHKYISEQIDDLRQRRDRAIKARDYLATQPPLAYSDQAWHTPIDHATISPDGVITHFHER